MTKLKTLKDRIDKLKQGCGKSYLMAKEGESKITADCGIFKDINIINLCPICKARLDELEKQRQEAIKWIKNCEWRGFSITACTDTDRCIACIRTMKMNNIIEGDLE